MTVKYVSLTVQRKREEGVEERRRQGDDDDDKLTITEVWRDRTWTPESSGCQAPRPIGRAAHLRTF
jgi:hypothetical protein